MAEWKKAVERWRDTVRSELELAKCPLPVDLILSVIHVESRGYPGHTNPKSGASGLMQVMPGTLAWYNKQTGTPIPLSKLRSPDYPREQIRVGIWVLGQFWRSAHKYMASRLTDVPVDELGKIADLFYVAGPAAAKKRLDQVAVPFFSYVESRFPKWNALPHPRNVWKVLPDTTIWPTESIASWLKAAIGGEKKSRNSSIFLLIIMAAGYWWFMKRR